MSQIYSYKKYYNIFIWHDFWQQHLKPNLQNSYGKLFIIVVKEKQKKEWKQWKLGGSKEEYQLAKKAASRAVYDAKQQPQSKYFQDINANKDWNKIFKMA